MLTPTFASNPLAKYLSVPPGDLAALQRVNDDDPLLPLHHHAVSKAIPDSHVHVGPNFEHLDKVLAPAPTPTSLANSLEWSESLELASFSTYIRSITMTEGEDDDLLAIVSLYPGLPGLVSAPLPHNSGHH